MVLADLCSRTVIILQKDMLFPQESMQRSSKILTNWHVLALHDLEFCDCCDYFCNNKKMYFYYLLQQVM